MIEHFVITVDGPAGSGKSSIARLFEERLSFYSINSGSFYRAATYLFLQSLEKSEITYLSQHKDTVSNMQDHIQTIIHTYVPFMQWKNHHMFFSKIIYLKERALTHIDNETLFSNEIDSYVSQISRIEELRFAINTRIRSLVNKNRWIIEGRDAGTHILPEASLKFYLDADISVRIKRRQEQYVKAPIIQDTNNKKTTELPTDISDSLRQRDISDMNKGKYSLKRNSDLFYINSSKKTLEQIYKIMYTKIKIIMHKDKNNNSTSVVDVNIPVDFDKMIDSSFQKLYDVQNIHQGDIINGDIVKITDSDVFLDIGLKTEGRIAITEFENFDVVPKLGESIQVYVLKNNTENLNVSFAKAQELQSIGDLSEAYKNHTVIKAQVKHVIPNGFIVQIASSLQAFVPISQMDIVHILEQQAHNYIDKEYEFLILELYRNKRLQPILSRKKLLIERLEKAKDQFITSHSEGDIVTGVVKTFTSFGVFIDLNGFDALLHISDISWKHSFRPTEVLKKNDEHDFKIIKIDRENKKISVSLKALQPNPWDNIQEQYPVGTIVHSKVTKVLSYGAFVSIDQEIEGFIHISEMSWLKHIKHPSELLAQGSIVKCKVLHIDYEKKRISLGLKQAERNPWETVDSLYPVGYKICLPIKNINQYGIVVGFEEGYRGIIENKDISWTKQYHGYKRGQEIECVVLSHDKENHQINLGIKQLSDNPWDSNFLELGKSVEGIITSVTDFGVFVKFPNGLEGLIPKNKTYDAKEHASYEEVRPKFKIGHAIQAVILSIQKKEKRIMLSVQALKEIIDQQELEKHIIRDVESERAMSLGDMITNDKNQ